MKKPIEEVIEKAAKGEARVTERGDIYIDGYFVASTCDNGGLINQVDDANAALIAHCLNNFGPMLEALKEATNMIRAEWIEDSASTIIRCEQAIESASTVEVSE